MATKDSEVLPARVDVATTKNPFAGTRVESTVPVGLTLREIVAAQGLRETDAYGVQVWLNGEIVPDRMLDRVKPKEGTRVFVRVVPHGGEAGKAVLTIVVGVLAIAAVAATGGALGAAGGLFVGSFTAEGFAAAAGIMAGLSGIATGIQSLVAPPPQVYVGAIPETQDSAALTGTRNTARLYKPIRTLLGRYRVYPDLLGKPFVEQVGKDSILRLLMCFGYGPMDIEDIKIGETPIADIPDIRYAVHKGWDDDGELTIFRDEVDADASFQPSLEQDGDEAILTSQAGPEELSFDLRFPAGLISFDSRGKPQPTTVRFTVEEREVGDPSWTYISTPTRGLEADTGITEVSSGTFDLKLKERGLVTRGLRWTVPAGSTAGAAHQVRIVRVSTTAGGATNFSACQVVVIRTIKPHIASSIPNLAKIELEINAADTGLSGVIDNLSAVCTSIAPQYDTVTGSWGPATSSSSAYNVTMFPTRNAAWLFAQVLRGPANSRPVADNRIDGPGLATWAGNLTGTGSYAISGDASVPRNIDAVADTTMTVRKLLSDIAGTGRAALNIVDGKYSVVQDIPSTTYVQHFTPRNSSGFTGSKAFTRNPHALKVSFVNPEKGYQKDERIVYDDGYSETGNVAELWDFADTANFPNDSGVAHTWGFHADTTTLNGHAVRFEQGASAPAGGLLYMYKGTQISRGVNFNGSQYTQVRIRMRAVRISEDAGRFWRGHFYFQNDTIWTSGTNPYLVAQRIDFDEPDWKNGSWIEIVFDMSANADWVGKTISHLQFRFSQGNVVGDSDILEIDWIRVDDGTKPATEFMDLSLWGVSDADQAWRDARYHIASHRLRPEIFTLTADVEHIVCNRGDLVRVSHDVIGVGYGGARLKTVTNSGGAFVSGTLDEEFVYDSQKSFAMRIRTADGNNLVIPLATQTGTSNVVTAIDPVTYSPNAAPAPGDLVLFGERDTESMTCIVQRISPRNDLTASLELVEYNDAVYDPGIIPAHTSNITLQNTPNLLVPIQPEIIGSPISDETAASYTNAGAPEPQILVNVVSPPDAARGQYAPTTHYHAQFRIKSDGAVASAWINAPRVEATGDTRIIIRPVDEGETYDIRVRAISDSAASASDWKYINNHTVVGLSTPPPAPTDLSVWGDAIRWTYGDKPADFAGFEVRFQSGSDATWSTGITLSDNIVTDNYVTIGNRMPPGTTTIMVRAVDLSGNLSDTLSAVKNIRTFEDRSVIFSVTWTDNWTTAGGTVTGATHNVSTGYLEADTTSSSLFYPSGPTASFWGVGTDDFWGVSLYSEMTFTGNYTVSDHESAWPANKHLPGRVRFKDLDIEGADYRVEYRTAESYSFPNYTYSVWRVWPGARELEQLEYAVAGAALNVEVIQVRVTVSGGTTQGKIKSAKLITEGTPRTYKETLTVSASGSTIDLTGLQWRKITSITVTPTTTGVSAQGALYGEAYDLDAEQVSTSPYELTGPTVILYDSSGAVTSAEATVVIEGY